MPNIKFFVEGREDANFIRQYCNITFNSQVTIKDFFIMGGWSGYKTGGTVHPEFTINSDDGGINLLIIDADNDFIQRKGEITTDKIKLAFSAELFLFPNANDSGCLENLLTEIVVDKKLIDCFKNYEACVKDYNKPLLKSRIYTYLDTLLHPYTPKSNSDDLRLIKNCDFANKQHWDLTSEYLKPLHDFLNPYF